MSTRAALGKAAQRHADMGGGIPWRYVASRMLMMPLGDHDYEC
jgi:hypothetical protein